MGNLLFTSPQLSLDGDQSAKNSPKMRKTFHTSLELVSKPLGVGQVVPDVPLWKRLGSSVWDTLFAKKLPPLELMSQPIAVADPLAVKRSPASSAISFVMHAAILVLALWFMMKMPKHILPARVVEITPVTFKPYVPVTVPAPTTMGGGGGGGAHEVVEAKQGKLPPVVKTQAPVPALLKVDHPKLIATEAAPTVAMPQPVKLPSNHMPNFGMASSPQVAMASQGSGAGGGFGQGTGGGIGAGSGAGIGSGMGGGYGGGVMTVGKGVSAPQLIHSVDPAFTDAARQARYQGIVTIQLIVDSNGNPQDIQVVRHLGMGLDQKAIAAVRQYKFKPAMYRGQPVSVQMHIDVNFQLN